VRARRFLSAALAAAAAAALSVTAASAQTWPTKPVKVLIGFAAGGPTDLIGRIMAEHLSKALGQPFVIESRPGASGVIAGQATASAPADGYTLNLVSFGIIATAKAMFDNMSYDPATAFAPVTVLVRSPLLLEVPNRLPVKTYAEFVAYAKANSGKLNHASPGAGTQAHLATELFRAMIGFDSQHIAYRGNGPMSQGMMQGEPDWGFDTALTALQLVKGNHVRLLAVATESRWPEFPDVPTLKELGVSGAAWPNWFGLVAPAATPKPIVEKLAAEIAAGWKQQDNVSKLRTLGYEPWTMTPDETAKFFAAERERWTDVVKANNIKAQ